MAYEVANTSGETQDATTSVVTLPPHIADDWLFIFMAIDGTSALTTPSGWTERANVTRTTASRSALYIFKATGSSTTNPTLTAALSTGFIWGAVTIRNADGTDPIDVVGTHNASSSPAVSGSITTTNAKQLIYSWIASDQAQNPSARPWGRLLLNIENSLGAADLGAVLVSRVQMTAAATPVFSVSNNVARNYTVIEVAIEDSSATIPGTIKEGQGIIWEEDLGASADFGTSLLDTVTVDGVSCLDTTFAVAADGDASVDHIDFAARFQLDTSTPASPVLRAQDYTFTSSLDLAASNRRMLTWHSLLVDTENAAPIAEHGLVAALHSSGAWRAWKIGGKDALKYAGEYVAFAIDANATATMIDSSGTFAPGAVTALTLAGVCYNDNRIRSSKIGYAEPFVIVGGSSTVPATFEQLVEYSAGGWFLTNIRQGGAQYLVKGSVDIGDGSLDIYFDANGGSLEWPAQADEAAKVVDFHCAVSHLRLGFNIASGDTCNLQNYVLDGKGLVDFDVISTTGTLLFRGLVIRQFVDVTLRDGTTYTYNSCTIDNCTNPVDANDAPLRSFTFSNASDAALLFDSTTDIQDSTFIDNNFAIRHSSTGTFTYDNLTFSGSVTNDVENDSGGLVTINVINGGDTPTVTNTGGGSTTTVNVSVTLTVTVNDVNGNPLEGFRVRIEDDPLGTLIKEGTTNASGIYTVVDTYTADNDVKVIARLKGWKTQPVFDTITSSGLNVVFSAIKDTVVNLP